MLKIKYEDLDNYNLSELKEIIKQLNEDNKTKDNIIKELEYRLEKLNIKIETKYVEYYEDEPLCMKKAVIKKQHIPAFDYYEMF